MRLSFVLLGAIVATVLIICGWSYWAGNAPAIAHWWLGSSGIEAAGQWGDTFGAFNALFGALGFAAVLTTLLVQARALQLQQGDMHRQRFEASFFELLGLLRNVRSELRFRYSPEFLKDELNLRKPRTTKEGKDAIITAVREIRYWILKHGGPRKITKSELVDAYHEYVHKRFESDFGPYFRLIYTMLDRIKSDIFLSADEQARYGNILRSQLPSHEIFLLGVNALSPVSKDLSTLIEEFRMLKYLPPGTRRNTLIRFFNPKAFAPRSSSETSVLLSLTPSRAETDNASSTSSGGNRPEHGNIQERS